MRETEALAKRLATPAGHGGRGVKAPVQADVHTRAAEERMRFALGTKVRILRRGQGGTIEVQFGSESELNRIFELISGKA